MGSSEGHWYQCHSWHKRWPPDDENNDHVQIQQCPSETWLFNLALGGSNINCQMIQEWLDMVLISTEPRAKDSGCGQPLSPVPLEICSHLLFMALTLNSISVLTRLCLWVLPILFQSKWDNEAVYLKPYKHYCLIFFNPAHFKRNKSQ